MSQAGQNAKSAVSGALPGSILEHSEFLKNLPGGVCVFHVRDGAWILDLVNDSWGRVHHLSAAGTKEMIGRDLLEKIVPEDRDDLRKQLEKADGSADGIAEATSRLQQEDGTCSWVCVQIRRARVREESAGCPCYYAVSTDVTGRVQAEEKLAESESTLREAVGIADILFFTYYPEKSRCEMRTANPRYAQLPSVWENFPDDFLVYLGATPKDRGACHEMLGKIAAGAENGECVLCTKQQGIDRWLRLHVTAVRDGAGGKAGAGTVRIQGYVLNVSDRVGAAEQFRREQLRVKTLEGSAFEAFSFCLTREAPIALQTRDTDMQKTKVTDDMVRELLQIDPLMTKAAPETRNVLIRVGMRIPDPDERRKFYTACGGTALRRMLAEGIFVRKLRVRRRVGSLLRWVLCRIELVQDPDSGDFFAFFYSSDINEKVTSEQVLSHVMSINYEEVSCYDLQSGRVQSIREQDEKDGNAERNYIQMLEETVSGALSGEQEQLRRRLSLGNILEKLKDLPVYTMFYTMQETREDLPGDPHRQMKMDILFLNAHRDELLFLRTDVTEITERDREYKMQMADALTAAKAASAAKTNFLSRMSHEIRTPLNAIIGMDTIAAQSVGNDERIADCVSKIGLSARYLLSLINDILDMSRIESGKMLLREESFQFGEFLAGVNNIIYPQVRAKGLDYECMVSSDMADAYIGDSMKLQQILVNILGNSVKFTKSGKISLSISVRSRAADRAQLRFVINDTGCGIAEENLTRIFEAFEQVDTSSTTVFGGTGLGLAISKNLVSLMSGKISVRSIVGIGSEFTVDVPLREDREATADLKEALNLTDLHTLIVDDDMLVCEQTEAILRDIGMAGEWVTSGQEAVSRVTAKKAEGACFDFILIDWKMPDMDGLETTQRIRRIVGPDVTIIIISAYDWQSIESEARVAGANLLVSKPLLRSTLISAFEKGLGKEPSAPAVKREYDFSGKRILVAEDNELNAEIAKTLLEDRNFAVEIATDGIKAMEKFVQNEQGYYDAILMDVRMPVMDGLQATVNIRHWNRPDAGTIPIVAMTANAFDEDVEKSRAAGMNAHLSKPIDPEMLFATLHRLIEVEDE